MSEWIIPIVTLLLTAGVWYCIGRQEGLREARLGQAPKDVFAEKQFAEDRGGLLEEKKYWENKFYIESARRHQEAEMYKNEIKRVQGAYLHTSAYREEN